MKHQNWMYEENLKEFLTRNENRYCGNKYFKFLEDAQDEALQVRKLIVPIETDEMKHTVYEQEIRVVFGVHFKRRAEERMRGVYLYKDQIDAVMEFFKRCPKAAEIALNKPYRYDEDEGLQVPEGKYHSTILIKKGECYAPVITAGSAFLYIETIIPKEIDDDDVRTRENTEKVKLNKDWDITTQQEKSLPR